MSIQELTAVVPPPNNPVETGDKAQWREIQKDLNIKLPSDFYDLGMTYGSGQFGDDTIHLQIYQPFAPDFREQMDSEAANLSSQKEYETGSLAVPYPVFPDSPDGLLVCGSDDNGNTLLWLTKGKPDQWPIIVRAHDDDDPWEEHEGPLTSFLAKAFTRQIEVAVWPEPFFADPERFKFIPVEHEPEPITYSIFELYVRNGNKAGFWIKDPCGAYEPYRYFVKSIAGKTEGKLEGVPNEYNHQPVEALFYWNGKFQNPIETLRGHIVRWVLAEPHENVEVR